MQIKIEDLKVGDEILFPTNGSKMIRAKVLEEPQLSSTQSTWFSHRGLKKYKSIKCAIHCEEKEIVFSQRWRKTLKIYHLDGEYNAKKKIDLSGKENIWLLKRD